MKLKGRETVKLTKVIYVPQSVNNILSVSRIVSKGARMGATQEKMITKKNSVNMILDARKRKNKSMMFYLKAKRYPPEVSKPQEANINLPAEKK